jgi:uncharacterized protein YpuA (DUF1002 family)
MDREQLENRIKELGTLIEDASGNVKKLVDEQNTLTRELQDLSKPKLSHAQMDEIQHIVESACECFDLDTNECEMELQLDYDNRVQVEHFDWSRCQEDLTQHIIDRLEDFFAVVKNEG